METEDIEHRKETRDESSEVLWEALTRAQKAYDEVKKHADIVYNKEALKQAGEVRDAIKNQAKVVFADTWEQAEKEFHDTRYISQIQPIGSKGSHPDV